MATYNLTTTTPNKIAKGDILNCPYSGTYKSIELPKGEYKLEVWGAQGGTNYGVGGRGGYSVGTLTLNNATELFLYSGGVGLYPGSNTLGGGGFNGGGHTYYYAGGGGGASDIRIGENNLYARVIVAGGGGGTQGYSGYTISGGAGGGLVGQYGSVPYISPSTEEGGCPGTQTSGGEQYDYSGAPAGGSFGVGGNGFIQTSTIAIGAGGGGWYGGGSGYNYFSTGGGGSGYVYTESTASNYPSNCLLNSNYYLSDAETIAGTESFIDYSGSTTTGHEGDGACRITVLSAAISGSIIWFKNSSNIWQKMN